MAHLGSTLTAAFTLLLGSHAGIAVGAVLATWAGLHRARAGAAAFQFTDGLLFGAAGGLLGGLVSLAAGLWLLSAWRPTSVLGALLSAILWSLVAGATLGALVWGIAEWHTTAAERAQRRAGDLTVR